MRLCVFSSAVCTILSCSYALSLTNVLERVQGLVVQDSENVQTMKDIWDQGELGNQKLDIESVAKLLNTETLHIPNVVKEVWGELAESDIRKALKDHLQVKKPKQGSKRHSWDRTATSEKFPDHSLRYKSTKSLGIDTVEQYSGYLDNEEEDKHFFFWFFESRSDPENDPVVLWLNGGPGCSSMTGLFFELGPSSIGKDLKPIYNPYSWNNNSNVIFLDQPVNVGNSYSSEPVSTTEDASKDVFALLNLFFQEFPQFQSNDFHIAGESYAGHYIPAFAKDIIANEQKNFNLTSVLIGNGLTDLKIQSAYYGPMGCGEGGYPAVLTPEQCDSLDSKAPRCQLVDQTCYDNPNVLTCLAAELYCDTLLEPYTKTGRNVYDIRQVCDNELCYPQDAWIDEYMNLDEVKEAIGSEVDTFVGCDSEVNTRFALRGDGAMPFQQDVKYLLESGLPVLLYAGDKDYICNWLGNQAWSNALEWDGADSFASKPLSTWTVDGVPAGEVKNSGLFTFLRVYDAGHMGKYKVGEVFLTIVPFNQGKNSLHMLNTWISGDYGYVTVSQ